MLVFNKVKARIVESITIHTFEEHRLKSNYNRIFLQQAVTDVIRRICMTINVDELSPQQMRTVIFLIKKVLSDKYNIHL